MNVYLILALVFLAIAAATFRYPGMILAYHLLAGGAFYRAAQQNREPAFMPVLIVLGACACISIALEA